MQTRTITLRRRFRFSLRSETEQPEPPSPSIVRKLNRSVRIPLRTRFGIERSRIQMPTDRPCDTSLAFQPTKTGRYPYSPVPFETSPPICRSGHRFQQILLPGRAPEENPI